MILITGATGHLGSATARHLLQHLPPGELAILARDRKKAEPLAAKGVEVRLGDFDDQESLDKALEGISKILLIPSIVPHRVEQNERVIGTAGRKGIKHIIYTGVSHKNIETSEVMGLDDHFKTEERIRESGLDYTFLRNNLYMDLLPFYGGDQVLESGFYLPAGNGRVPFALRREMGEAAGNVLLQDGHENKVYEINGGELFSFHDAAAALSKLTGKNIGYTAVESQAYAQQLKDAGVEDFVTAVLNGFNLDIRNGQFEQATDDLAMLLGRKPLGLKDGMREIFHL